jgi:predicted transposase/invertase (TIGR01784 family)
MAALWLRFLKEVKEQSRTVPEELLSEEDIRKALTLCEEGAFTPEELAAYERYWDIISTEKGLISRSTTEGIEKGRAEGRAEGEAIGIQKGEAIGMQKGEEETIRKMVQNALRNGFSVEQIQAITNLSEEKIREIVIGLNL